MGIFAAPLLSLFAPLFANPFFCAAVAFCVAALLIWAVFNAPRY